MSNALDKLIESHFFWWCTRLLILVVFLSSGIAKTLDFQGGMAEMEAAGLSPAWLFNTLTAATLLGGAIAILSGSYRGLLFGATILGGFLILTIIVVNRFWALPQPEATLALYFALEHLSLIGGLCALVIAGYYHEKLRRWG